MSATATAGVPSALARKTARRQTSKVVAGVTLTRTGLGWKAQGWHLSLVEDTPPYWEALHPGHPAPVAARTLTKLVGALVRAEHLKKDAS